MAPSVYRLDAGDVFASLSDQQKRHVHFLSQAAWAGTRIILAQVSPESVGIFDFILRAYDACKGDWDSLINDKPSMTALDDIEAFLNYAATFLSNLGNFYATNNRKFIPACVSSSVLEENLATRTPELEGLWTSISGPMYAVPPDRLGDPTTNFRAQSAYYIASGAGSVTPKTVEQISRALEERGISVANTRISRVGRGQYEVLQASCHDPTATDDGETMCTLTSGETIRFRQGEFSDELSRVCEYLEEAGKYTSDGNQRRLLSQYVQGLRSGQLAPQRAEGLEGQTTRPGKDDDKTRVNEIEGILDFIGPCRDPHGIRTEFAGVVGIHDEENTRLLKELVAQAEQGVWQLFTTHDQEKAAISEEEPSLKRDPESLRIKSIQALAYCSSTPILTINPPAQGEDQSDHGPRTVFVVNYGNFEATEILSHPSIDSDIGITASSQLTSKVSHWQKILHELVREGFVGGGPVLAWKDKLGDSSELASTINGYHAGVTAAYLMTDANILNLLDCFHDMTPDDVLSIVYLLLVFNGLHALRDFYDPKSETWEPPRAKAPFVIMKDLLADGICHIDLNRKQKKLVVRIDRSRVDSFQVLERMLLQLHEYRHAGDENGCREYVDNLSRVDDQPLDWREVLLAKTPRSPSPIYVQANTFLQDGGRITLREYQTTIRGVIQSWAERRV